MNLSIETYLIFKPSFYLRIINILQEIHSPPLTPIINEDNKDAALKMFAAYNGKKEHISSTITSIQQGDADSKAVSIMSCGIQGGSVLFNSESDLERENQDRHGILRSYTIGSDYRTVDSTRWKFKKDAKKCSSYGGSPSETLNVKARSAENVHKKEPTELHHCYPTIKIINENNVEHNLYSDSEESVVKESNIPVVAFQPQSDSKAPQEVQDSGYPSTTMSNVTHCSSQVEDVHPIHTASTAAERRKLFTSKAKSASFYNIGTVDADRMPLVNDVHSLVFEGQTSHRHGYSSAEAGGSFESERNRPCHREELKRLAFSYESDLNKLHRLKRMGHFTIDERHSYSKHKHSRHRHKCGCNHRHRRTYRDVLFNLNQTHSRSDHSYQNDWRDGSRLPGYKNGYFYSSTDSDSYIEHARAIRMRQRNFRTKGAAFSENQLYRPPRSYDLYTPEQRQTKQYSFKARQMHSFLKDAYKAKVHGYDSSDNVGEDRGENDNDPMYGHARFKDVNKYQGKAKVHNIYKRSNTESEKTRETIQNVHPDQPPYTYPSEMRLKGNSSQFSFSKEDVEKYVHEYDDNKLPNKTKLCTLDHSSASDRNIYNTDESVTLSESGQHSEKMTISPLLEKVKQKDSAYQTKQSSVDRLKDDRCFSNSSSIKHRQEIYFYS